MNLIPTIQAHLRTLVCPEYATRLQGFFKTRPWEYGAGDIFLGIRMPDLRVYVKTLPSLSEEQLTQLLASPHHEERLLSLLVMVRQYQKGDATTQEQLYHFYMAQSECVNNWDLVDLSAPYIPGPHLYTRDREILLTFARSHNLWQRRIAVVTTFYFIRQGDLAWTVKLAEMLLCDSHDLIHKSVGWMLREAGKRDIAILETFLHKHAPAMPRTMLRYAIEKFPPEKRQFFMGIR